jgi:uncharacterized protein YkwD
MALTRAWGIAGSVAGVAVWAVLVSSCQPLTEETVAAARTARSASARSPGERPARQARGPRPPAADSSARAMLDAVNAERSRRGLGRLTLDSRLAQAAATQAQDLVTHGRFTHRGSDGSTVGDRADRAGYRWARVAENLARTAPSATPDSVVRLWMNSPGHRANLLSGQFTEMGVAHRGPIWVLVLARPLR